MQYTPSVKKAASNGVVKVEKRVATATTTANSMAIPKTARTCAMESDAPAAAETPAKATAINPNWSQTVNRRPRYLPNKNSLRVIDLARIV